MYLLKFYVKVHFYSETLLYQTWFLQKHIWECKCLLAKIRLMVLDDRSNIQSFGVIVNVKLHPLKVFSLPSQLLVVTL